VVAPLRHQQQIDEQVGILALEEDIIMDEFRGQIPFGAILALLDSKDDMLIQLLRRIDEIVYTGSGEDESEVDPYDSGYL